MALSDVNNKDGIDNSINDDSANDENSINDDRAINCNFLNNFEHHETDNESFNLQLQGWAIKNRITHVALNELMALIKLKYPELPRDARTLLGNFIRQKHCSVLLKIYR